MRINAALEYKRSEINIQACTVDDIIELWENDYLSFYDDTLQARRFFEERKGSPSKDGIYTKSLLMLGSGQNDGILVVTHDEDHALMSSFIPNARQLVEAHIKQLADYAVSEGTEHSEDGKWETSYEELYNHFGANLTPNNGNCKLLVEALRKRKEVDSLTVTEDGIDVTYKPEYCKNLQEQETEPVPRKLYMAYGKGMNLKEMKRQCPDAELVGVGEIDGYELRFKGIAQYATTTLCPKQGESVPVVVWKLREDDVKKLNKHEGGNDKKVFPVQLDNGYTVNAIGFYSNYDYSIAMPSKKYFQEVYQGYVDNGFDVQILSDALINSTQEFYTKTKQGWLEQSTPYEEPVEQVIAEDECSETQLGSGQVMM